MADNTDMIPSVYAAKVLSGNAVQINTLNTDTFDGKITALNALNNAVSLKDATNPLKICDCIALPGVRKGRNNTSDTECRIALPGVRKGRNNTADTECQNTYLIDVDGNAYFTQSDGIARSVRMIYMLFPDFGKSSDVGYLKVRVVEKKLPNGNTIKSLVVDA